MLPMPAKKWIQGMNLKKGALHKQMHIPQDEKIPVSRLKAASKGNGVEAHRARVALTLRKMHSMK